MDIQDPPIETDDWLLARDILIRSQSTVLLSDPQIDVSIIITPIYFGQQLYAWQQFRITGIYPINYQLKTKLEIAFFLFCTRTNTCFSFIDPSEMKAMFDSQYRVPLSIWKDKHIVRKFRNIGETFFSVIPIDYRQGKALFDTTLPNLYVRRMIGSLTIDRDHYPQLLEELPDWVNMIILTVNVSIEFEHTVNIKLFGDNRRQWEGHGFSIEHNNIPLSHLDLIKMIAETTRLNEEVEEIDPT